MWLSLNGGIIVTYFILLFVFKFYTSNIDIEMISYSPKYMLSYSVVSVKKRVLNRNYISQALMCLDRVM